MIQVLIAEADWKRREALCVKLAVDADIEVAGAARSGPELIRQAHMLRPDIILLPISFPPDGGCAAAEALTASGLPLEIVLIAAAEANISEPDLRAAMRAGARDMVSPASAPADLCAAVRAAHAAGLRRRMTPASNPPAGRRVIAVSSAKGGVGKTTLAVNLAAALAVETGEPTVLLDLYTQFGDAALLLNLFPRRSLADLVSVSPADLDLREMEDHLERHSCGLRVLAGASAPLPLSALSPTVLDQMLFLLRSECHVVMDVPPVLHDTTRQALSQADCVLLVANLFDLTTLADTRHWLDALSGRDIAPDAVQIVLNRVCTANRLPLPDITRTLGRSAHCLVPNDGKLVPASVNAGVPFVLSHPKSKVAASVFGLARSLYAAPR